MSDIKELWVDKYRPSTLKDYVLNAELRTYFKNMVKNNALQHCTFQGCPGSGKTTLAKILVNEFNADVLFVKCATEGTIDVLRTKVAEFCNALSMEGKIKCVILDEVDSASGSGENNFQKGLRTLIESAQDDTRFILTCNHELKEKAIYSRCPLIPLSFDKLDLAKHVKKILDAEQVKYDKKSLKAFIEESFHYYPDCRRIINYLQLCCNSGELVVKMNAIVNTEQDDFVKEIVSKTLSEKNILGVRQYYIKNKEQLGDFIECSSLLFNYVCDNGIVTDSDGILKLADLIYQLNVVVDREPTFFGMLVVIKKYGIQK